MFTEKHLSESSINVKTFHSELTPAQYKYISSIMPQGYVLEIIVRPSKKEVLAPTLQKAQSVKPLKETSNPLPPLELSPLKKTMSTKSETNSIVSLDMPPVKKQKKVEPPKVKKTASVPPENKPLASIMSTIPPTMQGVEPQMPTTSSMPMKHTQSAHSTSEALKNCFNILQKIRSHRSAQPFQFPPNIVAPGIADFMMTKETMDLTTIEHKLRSGEYANPDQFNNDVRKIWFNARSFYPPGSDMNKMATEMSAFFENLIKESEPPILPPPVQTPADAERKLTKLSKQTSATKQKGGVQPMVDTKPKTPVLKEVALTLAEKRALYQNVNKLPPQYLKGVWDIVSEDPTPVQKSKDVIEFDLDNLSVEIARKLERYVNFHTNVLKKNEQTYKAQEQLRNPMTNPIGNPLANPMTNPMTNHMTNPMANPMVNPMINPLANPMINPMANPMTNPMGSFPYMPPRKEVKLDSGKKQEVVRPQINPELSFPSSMFLFNDDALPLDTDYPGDFNL